MALSEHPRELREIIWGTDWSGEIENHGDAITIELESENGLKEMRSFSYDELGDSPEEGHIFGRSIAVTHLPEGDTMDYLFGIDQLPNGSKILFRHTVSGHISACQGGGAQFTKANFFGGVIDREGLLWVPDEVPGLVCNEGGPQAKKSVYFMSCIILIPEEDLAVELANDRRIGAEVAALLTAQGIEPHGGGVDRELPKVTAWIDGE